MNTKKRCPNIDLLKGAAMILIVLLHSVQMIEGIPVIIRKPLLLGQIGVPLFFMCSGFLVKKTYLNNTEKITLKRHIKYIWGKYISLALPFVLFLIIYMWANAIFQYFGIKIPYENNTQPISVLLNVFLLHGIFPFCLNNVAPGAWYIGTLFILFLTAPIYMHPNEKRKFMPLIVSVIMAVLSLVLSNFFSVSVDNGSFFYFSFLNQLPAFLIGMGMADEQKEKIESCGSTLRFFKSLIFLALVMLLFVAEFTFSYALVPFFSAMAFKETYFLLESFGDCRIKHLSKILIYIGKNTYPIYLAHFLLVWYVPIIVKRCFELNGILLWIVALSSVFVLFAVSDKLNAFFAILIKSINKKSELKRKVSTKMSGKISIKEVIKNLIYSFVSFAMPTAVLQFLIQPILAKELGAELNGQYLTIISFHFFMVGITATVLNNVRLLQQKQYDEKNLCGDFNLFLASYALIAIVVVPLAWFYFTKSFNITDILLMICIAFMYIYHDYIFAEYRLNLQYNKIFANNILMSFGYIIGYFLFKLIGRWQVVLIGAYAMPTVYDFVNTTFIKEPLKKTPLFKETAKKVATLTCSNSLGTLTNYCDKFILYPILGGTSVSIYYSAALVGKLLLLVSSPLNSVLLSYLVKIKSFNVKSILKKFAPLIGVIIGGYIICVIVGFPLTSFLYPNWAEQSKQFIPITVAASMFSLLCHLLNTVVLRFYKMSYQIVLQVLSLSIYMSFAFAGLYFGGLFGFSLAIMCSNALKLLILIYIVVVKKPVTKKEGDE